MKKLIAVALLWPILYIVNVAGVFAGDRCNHGSGNRRDQIAFSVWWNLFPPTIIIVPFATGFYKDGLLFPWEPDRHKNCYVD